MRPRVSVVIAARNAAATLEDTLASLAAQRLRAWEALVVDDGSTDATAAIAVRWGRRDPRVRPLAQPASGPGTARNLGLAHARADRVLFLDADDWLLPDALATLADALDADPALDAVICGWARVAPDGAELGDERCAATGDLFDALACRSMLPIHACLVRRAAVEAIGGFDPALESCGDWDLWQRLARRGARFGGVAGSLARYRLRPGSVSSGPARVLRDGLAVIARGHGPDPRVTDPDPRHAPGAPADELTPAQLRFACWPAGLAMASGADPVPLLDLVDPSRDPELDPAVVAHTLFWAVPHGRARGFDVWAEEWDRLERPVMAFLAELERRTGAAALAGRAAAELERLAIDHAGPGVERVGRSALVRVEVTRPIPDLALPSGADRVRLVVEADGAPIGPVDLPAGAPLDAGTVADAIASALHWPLLGRLLEATVYRRLELRREGSEIVAWRGAVRIADGLPDDPTTIWRALHDRGGWLVFLQELWSRPEWDAARLYDPALDEPAGETVTGTEVTVEIARRLPGVKTPGTCATIHATLGGAPVGRVEIAAKRGTIAPATIRVALTSELGLELSRVAVRQAVLGRPFGGPPLRRRLAVASGLGSRADF